MCILVYIPTKAQRVNEAIIDQCWRSNPDGAGFMYPSVERNRLVVDKGHMTLEAIKTAFATIPEGVPVALHFRIKTHGLKDEANTHPHWVWPDEVAIAHNGVLALGAPADSTESDTARFARLVLPGLPKQWWKNAGLVHLVEEYLGRSNKMVVMDKTGSVKVLNEELGSWEQGVWFSNQTFRSYRTVYTGAAGYGYDHDSYGGGWREGHQTGASHYPAVVKPASSSVSEPTGVQPPVSPAGADQSSATTQRFTPQAFDEPVAADDPLVKLVAADELDASDRALLCKSIGDMTEREFGRYEEIMDAMMGVK